MIARPEQFAADYLAEAHQEVVDTARRALYIVGDPDSEQALLDCDVHAVHVARHEAMVQEAEAAAARGAHVSIVNASSLEAYTLLQERVPQVRIRELRMPPSSRSVATMLGYMPLSRWEQEVAAVKRDTFLDWAAGVDEDGRPHEVNASEPDEDAVVPFPVEMLPPALRSIVREGALAQNVDVAFFGVPLLPILAGAIGASRQVQVREGWTEPFIIWAAVVAPSGSGKSPPLDVLLQPVRDRDEELLRQSQLAFEDYKQRLAEWNRAQRRKDSGDCEPEPEAPPTLCGLVDDVTTEALAVRLGSNPRGVTLAADELATWLGGFDAYRGGRGGDEAKWLGMYGGRPLKVDRKSGGTLYVPSPHVSVVGGVQPRVAQRVLGRSQRESGLAARLLLAAPPTGATLWSEARISRDTLANYAKVVRSLLDLQLHPEPQALRLSSGARALFVDFHDRLAEEGDAAAKSGDEDTAAAMAKLRSAVPRIAGVLALAKAAEDGIAELQNTISEEAMRCAMAIGHYFARQARAVYSGWKESENGTIAARILTVIRNAKESSVTRTEIRDALGRNVHGKEIDAALDRLSNAGLIERVPVEHGIGRPPERWRLVGGSRPNDRTT